MYFYSVQDDEQTMEGSQQVQQLRLELEDLRSEVKHIWREIEHLKQEQGPNISGIHFEVITGILLLFSIHIIHAFS